MKLPGVILLSLIIFTYAYSQNDTTLQHIEPFDPSAEAESSSYIEYIFEYFSTGINLNRASKEDFLELIDFDEETADKIIAYRNSNGKFYSIGELYNIPGINQNIIRRYFSLFRADLSTGTSQNISGNFSLRNEKRFDRELPPYYLGNGLKQKMKAEFTYGENITARIITEKDPGEQKFADHYAGFISIRNTGFLKNITLGSFILRSPTGLLSNALYYIPSGNQSLKFTNELLIKGFSSTEENRYMQGGAAKFEVAGVTLTPFYSQNYYDGGFLRGEPTFYLIEGGIHSQSSSLQTQDALLVKSGGLSAALTILPFANGSITYYNQEVSSSSNNLVNNYGAASLSAIINDYVVLSEFVYNRGAMNTIVHAGRKSKGVSPAGIYFRRLFENTLPIFTNPYRETNIGYTETGGGFYFRINPFAIPFEFTADIFYQSKLNNRLEGSGFRLNAKAEKNLAPTLMLRTVYSLRSKDGTTISSSYGNYEIANRHSLSVILLQKISASLSAKNRVILNWFESPSGITSNGYTFNSEMRYHQEKVFGVIAGFAGFSGNTLETASYISESSFFEYSAIKSLMGTGIYLYTTLFVKLPLNFTLSTKINWEHRTDFYNMKDKNLSGSLLLLYEW